MLSAVFLFSVALFCRNFLDITRYACIKYNKNTLNIKQKYRLNSNDRFGFTVSLEQYHAPPCLCRTIIRYLYPSYQYSRREQKTPAPRTGRHRSYGKQLC